MRFFRTRLFFKRYGRLISIGVFIISVLLILALDINQTIVGNDLLRRQNESNQEQIENQEELKRLFENSDKQSREDHELQQRYLNCIVIFLLDETPLGGQELIDRCEKQAVSPSGLEDDEDTLFNRTQINNIIEKRERQEEKEAPQNPDPPNNPPNPPSPQSILPLIDEPLVGCPLGICI